MEVTNNTFLNIFSQLKDPRVENDNKKHLLIDIITIAVCAVICRCESWEEIAEFGRIKQNWFKRFLVLPNGIPSHDTFRRVFMILNPKEFNRCFVEWTQAISEKFQSEVIAIDGKTICGSRDHSLGKKAIHMVSAWATSNGVVLSQLKVADKSNEITAIPEVLKSLDIEGAIVTMDAMGCQTEIAQQIVKQKGDYVLALKKNHLGLHQRVEEAFKRGFETDFEKMDLSYHQTTDDKHGRFEERNYFVINNVGFLNQKKEWKGLSSIGLVESIVNRGEDVSIERRYYLLSFKSEAAVFGSTVRKHWQVENNLHWVMDVQFKDDSDYKRAKNSAANFSMIKRVALNLLKKDKTSGSTRNRRLKASYNDEYLKEILMGKSV